MKGFPFSEEKEEDKGEQGEKKLKGDKSGTTAESSKSQWIAV